MPNAMPTEPPPPPPPPPPSLRGPLMWVGAGSIAFAVLLACAIYAALAQ